MAARKRVSKPEANAPYGWDVVGQDGRRIARSLPKVEAWAEANRIMAATDHAEELSVIPATIASTTTAFPGEPDTQDE